MPNTRPPMTATTERTGDSLFVTVEHDAAQSYSRAVGPRATRAALEAGRGFRTLTLLEMHAHGTKDGTEARAGVRCTTTYTYRLEA